MAVTDPFASYQLGAEGASICFCFWSEDKEEAARAECSRLWGVPLKMLKIAATSIYPPAVVVEYPDVVATVIGGAMTIGHFNSFLAGMLKAPLSWDAATFNTACLGQAGYVMALMDSAGFSKLKRQLLIGHSMGGASVGLMALAIAAQADPWGPVQVVTYGMPKPGNQAASDAALRLQMVRWMTEADPVPRIWPDWEDSTTLNIVSPISLSRPGLQTVQWPWGCLLRNDGTVGIANYPDPVPGSFAGQLATWWSSISGDPAHPHHALSYFAKLSNLANRFPPTPANNPPRANVAPNNPPRLLLHDQRAAIAAEIMEFTDAPEGMTSRGTPVASAYWRYAKENGVYNVYLVDDFVCSFRHRSPAKKMVAGGNKCLHSYVRSPIGDTRNMTAAMEDFLNRLDLGEL